MVPLVTNFFGRNDCRKHQNGGDDKRKVQHKMTGEYVSIDSF